MGRGAADKSTPSKVAAAKRTAEAVALRLGGATFDSIAGQLGYSNRSAAYMAVTRWMARIGAEDAEKLRALENVRLDAMLVAIWPRVLGGDLGAIDRALRISERRCRINGVDLTPVTIQETHVTNIGVTIAYVRDWRDAVEVEAEVVEAKALPANGDGGGNGRG